MTRAIFGEALLFFVPFAVFALYLLALRRNPFTLAAWSERAFWLAVAGLGLVAAALILGGVLQEREQGAFTPTRVENGRVVPGEFR